MPQYADLRLNWLATRPIDMYHLCIHHKIEIYFTIVTHRGATTLSMMTFRTTTLSMKRLFATLNIRDTQLVNALVSSGAMLTDAFYFLKFNYSECLGALTCTVLL